MSLTLRRLSKTERRWVSVEIDNELRRRAAENGLNALGLHRLRTRMNVLLSQMMVSGGEAGFFLPDDEIATLLPVILVDGGRSRPSRARVLAHELAHHLMRDWVAGALYDTDAVICTDQDNRAVRHSIARAVERNWDE